MLRSNFSRASCVEVLSRSGPVSLPEPAAPSISSATRFAWASASSYRSLRFGHHCARPHRHDRFDHVSRRRIGCGFGAADLADRLFDLGKAAQDSVADRYVIDRLAHRHARCGEGHVHDRAFVQLGHELATEMPDQTDADADDDRHHPPDNCRAIDHVTHDGLVDVDEAADDPVLFLAFEFALDEATE